MSSSPNIEGEQHVMRTKHKLLTQQHTWGLDFFALYFYDVDLFDT